LTGERAIPAATEPTEAGGVGLQDALAIVHERGPGEVIGGTGQAAGLQVIQDHPQIAQAEGLGAS
jgi:hypothetical protein